MDFVKAITYVFEDRRWLTETGGYYAHLLRGL